MNFKSCFWICPAICITYHRYSFLTEWYIFSHSTNLEMKKMSKICHCALPLKEKNWKDLNWIDNSWSTKYLFILNQRQNGKIRIEIMLFVSNTITSLWVQSTHSTSTTHLYLKSSLSPKLRLGLLFGNSFWINVKCLVSWVLECIDAIPWPTVQS